MSYGTYPIGLGVGGVSLVPRGTGLPPTQAPGSLIVPNEESCRLCGVKYYMRMIYALIAVSVLVFFIGLIIYLLFRKDAGTASAVGITLMAVGGGFALLTGAGLAFALFNRPVAAPLV